MLPLVHITKAVV